MSETLIRHNLPLMPGATSREAGPHEKLRLLLNKLSETVAALREYPKLTALVEVQEVVIALRNHLGAEAFDKLSMATFLQLGSYNRGIVEVRP